MDAIPLIHAKRRIILPFACILTIITLCALPASAGESGQSPTISIVPGTATVTPGDIVEYTMVVDTLPGGLAGYRLDVTLSDPQAGEFIAVSYPAWAVLNNTTGLPASHVRMSGVDLNRQVEPGASGIILGSFMIHAGRAGSTDIVVHTIQMDADGGGLIIPVVGQAELVVEEPVPEPPVAAFTASPRSGYAPLEVRFMDLSTGIPVRWAWDFDSDGSVDSTEKNPVYTYHNPGQYGVTLTVTNAGGADTEYKAGYITVQAVPTETGSIRGWVGSGSDYGLFGIPGIRVRVAATPDDLHHAGRYYEATTDREGRYTVTGLPSGTTLYAIALSPASFPDLYTERPVQYQVNTGSLVTCTDFTTVPTIPALFNGHDTQLNWILTRKPTSAFFFF